MKLALAKRFLLVLCELSFEIYLSTRLSYDFLYTKTPEFPEGDLLRFNWMKRGAVQKSHVKHVGRAQVKLVKIKRIGYYL